MPTRITGLGTLRVEHAGRVLDRLPAQRVRCALLLHLAVERESSREAVMGLLWPDRPPARAKRLLSQTLYELRQDLGDDWVVSTGDLLRVADTVTSDIVAFVSAVEAGDHEAALRLYGGPLLGGAVLDPSRPLEGWLERLQARLTRLHRQARRGAIDARVAAGDLGAALAFARTWVELDPLDDEAQHRFIELLAATGDRTGALGQYDRYEALVAEELELEPLDHTKELVERIRAGEVGKRDAVAVPDPEPAPPDLGPGSDPAPEPAVSAARAGWRSWIPGDRKTRVGIGGLLVVAVGVIAGGFALWLTGPPVEGVGRIPEVVAAETLDPKRIAVLYFDDLSQEQDLRYMAAGFTEALIHHLAQVEDLEVVSRNSVSGYPRMGGAVHDSIVAHLRVGTIVEGSVTRIGDQIRVTVQLIDGLTAKHLLSRTLDSPADSLGALLEALPREAALLLRRRLGMEIRLRRTRAEANDPVAWELLHRGRQMRIDAGRIRWDDLDAGVATLNRADSLLAKAEALDPQWAEPLLERAELEWERARMTSRVASQLASGAGATAAAAAVRHLDRVLARWPAHPEALARRGLLHFELAESGAGGDSPDTLYDVAEANLRASVTEDGDLAEGWWGLSEVLLRRGEFAEAKRAAHHALDKDAFLTGAEGNLFHLFNVMLNNRDFDEAEVWCDELKQRYPEGMTAGYCEMLLLVSVERIEPDVERAREVADFIVEAAAESRRGMYRQIVDLYVARVLVRAGRPDEARAVLRNAVPGSVPSYAAYDVAHVRLLLDDIDGALEALALHVEAYPGRAQSLDRDWWFERLWGDPRFQSLTGVGPG